MALGKPLSCIHTTGYTRYFSADYAELIQRKGREETIDALAASMLKLCDAELRAERGKLAQEAGRQFGWRARGEEIHAAIMSAWKEKGGSPHAR